MSGTYTYTAGVMLTCEFNFLPTPGPVLWTYIGVDVIEELNVAFYSLAEIKTVFVSLYAYAQCKK